MSALALLDLAAVFVFGLSGAFAASRAQLDIVGFVFLASLTALGGGTTRDVLLDRTVFWIDRPDYLATAAASALLIYVTAHLVEAVSPGCAGSTRWPFRRASAWRSTQAPPGR